MGMNSAMSAKSAAKKNGLRESALMKMYKDDRNYRADKLIESWSRIPEVGAGLKQMPIDTARNTAINLDR